MKTDNHEYRVDISWKEGRIGTMSSPELKDEIEVATPPQFPGGVEGIWSPEHLFISSVSSCFMTTFVAIAENSNLEFESIDIKATGKMDKKDGKYMMTEITLYPDLLITDDAKSEKAKRIMEKAEAACLISRSVKTEIKLEPKVSIGSLS
jgi:peroxiredoxin-like protein